MLTPNIVFLPGDGIGPVVLEAARHVLSAAGFKANYVPAEIGWSCWLRDGCALPERTVTLLRQHRVGLFGAISSRPLDEAMQALPEPLRRNAAPYESPILALRRALRLETSLRPCLSWPDHPANFIQRAGDRIDSPSIDVMIVMQNTEGLYAGVEWSSPPDDVRQALDRHPRMAPFAAVPSSELAVSCRVVSRGAALRIARAAFQHAAQRGIPQVVLCDKWGVMRDTASMMTRAARDVAAAYPGIELVLTNVDAQLMWAIRRPEATRVILCSAFVGDLLSDAYAALTGGLGMAPCANLGEECALFEPLHGSAPHHAAHNPPLVNPIGAILAAAMMAEHLADTACAERMRRAVARVITAGEHRTFDMLRLPGTAHALKLGACTTAALTSAIIAAL